MVYISQVEDVLEKGAYLKVDLVDSGLTSEDLVVIRREGQ